MGVRFWFRRYPRFAVFSAGLIVGILLENLTEPRAVTAEGLQVYHQRLREMERLLDERATSLQLMSDSLDQLDTSLDDRDALLGELSGNLQALYTVYEEHAAAILFREEEVSELPDPKGEPPP